MTNTSRSTSQALKSGRARPINPRVNRRFVLSFLTSAALGLALPASAGAATLSNNANWLSFDAVPGEVNNVTISDGGMGVVIEDANPIDASSLGGSCAGSGTTQVTCTAPYQGLKADLGDGGDSFSVTSALRAKVDGGPGGDSISGGPLDDQLDGGADGDVLNGGAGADELVSEA